jgi:hypothetical protein
LAVVTECFEEELDAIAEESAQGTFAAKISRKDLSNLASASHATEEGQAPLKWSWSGDTMSPAHRNACLATLPICQEAVP